jgi:YggT family protein
VVANELLITFIQILSWALTIALVGRVLSSWFRVGPGSPFYPVIAILYQVTEPILAPIRKILPRFGMLDLSPMVALFLLSYLSRFIVGALS